MGYPLQNAPIGSEAAAAGVLFADDVVVPIRCLLRWKFEGLRNSGNTVQRYTGL